MQELMDFGGSDLREAAGLAVQRAGPKEATLRRACGRLLHVDDMVRIDTYRRLLSSDEPEWSWLLEGPKFRNRRPLLLSQVLWFPQVLLC